MTHKHKKHTTYTTEAEIRFIKGLGDHAPQNRSVFGNANYVKHLLLNYIAGAKRRENWGQVDQKQCIDFAEERLRHV